MKLKHVLLAELRCSTMELKLCSKPRHQTGFTLVELMVSLAIIAILAALLLPVLSRGKGRAQGIYCMSNTHQLIAAVHLYAADFNDWLPPNPEHELPVGWVKGTMKIAQEATNVAYLTDPQYAKLASYNGGSASNYKCPADKSTVTINGIKYPRVRTVSMNQAVGNIGTRPPAPVDGPWLDGTDHHKANQTWRTYGKLSDMTAPSPAGLWVLIDEDEHLINDAAFAVAMAQPTRIIDWPGVYHNFSAGLAFADGHSEIHTWTDARTRIPSNYLTNPEDYLRHKNQPGNADIAWLQYRTSASVTNQP